MPTAYTIHSGPGKPAFFHTEDADEAAEYSADGCWVTAETGGSDE